MAAADYYQTVQSIYIAYYQRPADPGGLRFWAEKLDEAGGDLSEIIDAFANSQEALDLYGEPGDLTIEDAITADNVGDFINDVYNALFNRPAEQAGIDFYTQGFIDGTFTAGGIALDILNGALNDDAITIANKLNVANKFTQAVDGRSFDDPEFGQGGDFDATYAGEADAVAARLMLAGVGIESGSVLTNEQVRQFISENIADAGDALFPDEAGSNFILTSNVDAGPDFTGGSGNDTFFATQDTLNLGDSLRGGDGEDLLTVSIAGQQPGGFFFEGFGTEDIEKIQLRSISPSQVVLNMSDTKGVTTLESFEVETNAFAVPAVVFEDIQRSDIAVRIIDTDEDHTFIYDTNAFGGNAALDSDGPVDTLDLYLQEVRDGGTEGNDLWPWLIFEERDIADPDSDFEVVNLTSASRPDAGVSPATSNFVDWLSVGSDFHTLNIDGDADLEIRTALDPGVSDINANLLAADLTLTVNSTPLSQQVESEVLLFDGFPLFTYNGAQGDDDLSLTRTGDSLIDLFTGNDSLEANGDGDMTVFGGDGSDDVMITASASDESPDGEHLIDLGDDNDWAMIEGTVGEFTPDTASDDVTQATVDAGAGDDTVFASYAPQAYVSASQESRGASSPVLGNYLVSMGTGRDDLTLLGDGMHDIDLGDGDDYLFIEGNVDDQNTLELGDGVTSVTAGDGDDTIDVNGGPTKLTTGDVFLSGDYFFDLGAGADDLSLISNGDQTVLGGTGADDVFIDGDGVHSIDLGADSDSLEIDGGRVGPGAVDFASPNDPGAVTEITAGGGDDTVSVTDDHFLDVDLGSGSDSLEMRAEDLTPDDSVQGGTGADTLILTNANQTPVRVGESETDGVDSIETYDLRHSGITLEVNDQMIDRADGDAITVNTQMAGAPVALPQLTPVAGSSVTDEPFQQGMTYADIRAVATDYFNGEYVVPGGDLKPVSFYLNLAGPDSVRIDAVLADMVEWITDNGVTAVDFNDATADGDNALFEGPDAHVSPSEVRQDDGTGLDPDAYFEPDDLVFFRVPLPEFMAVDITEANLLSSSGLGFTLEGGNIRDKVYGDEQSIQGNTTLTFDGPSSVAQSIEDTLVVTDSAQISAADMRGVTGAEIILFQATQNNDVEFAFELTDTVIDQTTGQAPLILRIDPSVPANSTLDVVIDPSAASANNDVIIQMQSNVTLRVDFKDGNGPQVVSEGDYGVIFDDGPYEIRVETRLEFTDTGDSLIGSPNTDDLFVADTLDFMQPGDTADGGAFGGSDDDTLQMNFRVFDDGENLERLIGDDIDLKNIEHFVFNTALNVVFGSLDGGEVDTSDLDSSSLESLTLGTGDDSIGPIEDTNPPSGETFRIDLNAGDDALELWGSDGDWEVIGGSGLDSVSVDDRSDSDSQNVTVDGVEFVDLGNGSDSAEMISNDSDAPNQLVTFTDVDFIDGSSEADNILAQAISDDFVTIQGNAGNDTINVGGPLVGVTVLNQPLGPSVGSYEFASVSGGAGSDLIGVDVGEDAVVYGDFGEDSIPLDNGLQAEVNGTYDDLIIVEAGSDAAVFGEWGDDTIDVEADNVTVNGGIGSDDITVVAYSDAQVDGSDGDDVITVTAYSDAGVFGGDGDDTITATFDDASETSDSFVGGGDGSDDITVNIDAADNDAVVSIEGGDGDDTIEVNWTVSDDLMERMDDFAYVSGGAGDDVITLDDDESGRDIVQFGVISYSDSQNVSDDTQGTDTITNFVFEGPGIAPELEDEFDFSDFLASDADGQLTEIGAANIVGGVIFDGTTPIVADTQDANAVISIAYTGDFDESLIGNTGSGTGGPIKIADNARAVVVVGNDADGTGISDFDIFYVQDVDSSTTGQTWKVDKVADVTAATAVGINSVLDNLFGGNETILAEAGVSNTMFGGSGEDTFIIPPQVNPDESDADVITDFTPGEDTLAFENTGPSLVTDVDTSNYADYATAQGDADTAMSTPVPPPGAPQAIQYTDVDTYPGDSVVFLDYGVPLGADKGVILQGVTTDMTSDIMSVN